MTAPFQAATIRPLHGAIRSVALVFLTGRQVDMRSRDIFADAASAAGVALFSYRISRAVPSSPVPPPDSGREPNPQVSATQTA